MRMTINCDNKVIKVINDDADINDVKAIIQELENEYGENALRIQYTNK